MSITDRFLKIEKNFSWSFLGFLLAIIFGAFSIYTVYFKDNNPKLDFIVESNTTVLDLKENVRKLDIIYKGENINENGKNLSIIKLKIYNSSDINILSSFFELRDKLGFKLENAEMVEKPEIIEYSSEEIKRSISFNLDSFGQVKFIPMMIDGGEYFTLKLLALHKKGQTPTVKPFGKISGIKHFKVFESYKTVKKTFWSELTEGGFWIHVVRFIGYFILLAIIIAIIIIPSTLISDNISTSKRKRNVKRYKEKKALPDTIERNLIYDMYLEFGFEFVNTGLKMLNNQEILKIQLRSYLRRKNRHSEVNESVAELTSLPKIINGDGEYNRDVERNFRVQQKNSILRILYDEKIIEIDNNNLAINKQFVSDLNEFISYLKLI